MLIRFLEPALAEFEDAVAYYESQSPELGLQFVREVRSAIERIVQYPEAWSPLSLRTRRCQTHMFPYGIIYQVRDDVLIVVAIMHLHREPKSWMSRLRDSSG